MALTDTIILLVGLIEIVLPSRTVRLCDGGFINWPAKGMFTAEDADFGTVGSVEPVGEAVSDQAPGGRLTLLPPSIVEAAALFQPSAQGAPIRFWLGEVNQITGAIVGTPQLVFDGLIDTIALKTERTGRRVEIEFMAAAEKLFMVREGNVLTPRFHKAVWPGELGLDHATGVPGLVPWGTPGPGRGTVGGVGGVPGGGGGGGVFGGYDRF